MTRGQLSRIFVTRVAIKPNYSVSYTHELTPRLVNAKPPDVNTAKGMLSDKSVKRIKDAANWLKYLSDGMSIYSRQKRKFTACKLVFITLTVPKFTNHPDVFFVVHMLQPMLKWMQRQYGCHLYIWKAEIQPERYYSRNERCIHFHITTNRFIHHTRLRNKWNELLRKNGVIDVKQNPPSTEIRAVKNDKGFGIYMAKYISKKETDKALNVNCKVWGCSHALSSINITLGEDLTDNFNEAMTEFTANTSKGYKKLKHATIQFTSLKDKKKLPPEILSAVAEMRDKIHNQISKRGTRVKVLRTGNSNDAPPEANHIKPIQLEVKW